MRTITSKYFPTPKQARFHADKSRYRLYLAGLAAGKTLAGVHECIFMAQRNPGFDGCIVAPTYPMLRDVIIPLWQEFIPEQLYTFYKKDALFKLWTGQKLYLRSGERPDAIRGLNLAFAWADELAMVQNEDIWAILQGRIGRTRDVPHPGLFATTTPRGWNWLARKFLKTNSTEYGVIRARTSDNPWVPPEWIENLRAEYGEEYARQELDAEVIETSGLVWLVTHNLHCNWTYDHVRQTEGGFKRVAAGVDWGFSHPASILIAGQTKQNNWYVVEEWYQRGKLPSEIYAAMSDTKRRWGVKRFWCDSAEPARIVEANSLGLRCQAVKKGSGSIAIGVQEVRQLLAPSLKTLVPKLYIHPSCKNLLREAESYHYKDGSEVPVGDNGDHACDALRYLIHSELNEPKIRGII